MPERELLSALPSALSHWLGVLLSAIFVIAIPICLIGNNVRWVTLNPTTYSEGFEKYAATERTGLDGGQLQAIARAFIDYFNGPPGQLNPPVTITGTSRPLFNEREVAHMVDVQQIMRLVFRLGLAAAAYLALFSIGLLVWQGRGGLAILGQLGVWGTALTFALFILVGALSLVDFSDLFIRFHQISFRNDLWILDPGRDYLLMLFPEGFWFDVTMKIALMTAVEALGVGAVGVALMRL